MKAKKIFFSFFISILLSLGFLEFLIRFITVRKDHVDYLFGKPYYYLVPFRVPADFPDTMVKPGSYRRYDADLGWDISPLGKDEPLYFSNALGERCSSEEYRNLQKNSTEATLPRSAIDIITAGDSFTHGDEVFFEQSWPALLEKKTGLEVMNQGVGGYGIDQAFLKYRKKNVKAPLVILGLISGDFERAMTQIYSFHSGGLKTKPLFVFEGESYIANRPCIYGSQLRDEFLEGEASPFFKREWNFLPTYFRHERWDFFLIYRLFKSFMIWKQKPPAIYYTDDERLAYGLRILKLFQEEVKKDGGQFVVVFLENKNTMVDRRGRSLPWSLLEKKLTEMKISFLNIADSLYEWQRMGNALTNINGVHYTAEANNKTADLITRSGILKMASGPKKL